MKVLILFTITQLLWINVVSLVIHVVPDHPNIINCPSQPCTTLDDLLLNNSLSNISNVEFKLLPGVYNATSNIVIQHVHNVSFVGVVNKSVSVVLKCFYRTSLQVICSYNVTISNLILQQCGGYRNWLLSTCRECELDYNATIKYSSAIYSPSLHAFCCSFTSVNNVTIQDHREYGIICYNTVGVSYLNLITVYTRNETSWGIMLYFDDNRYTYNYGLQNNTVFVMKVQIGVSSLHRSFANNVVNIEMMQGRYGLTAIVSDCIFANHVTVGPIVRIVSGVIIFSFNNIMLKNCTFSHIKEDGLSFGSIVDVRVFWFTVVTLFNCTFSKNEYTKPLVSVIFRVATFTAHGLQLNKVVLTDIIFASNSYCPVIFIAPVDLPQINQNLAMQVYLTKMYINGTNPLSTNYLISIEKCEVHFNENIVISNNSGKHIVIISSSIIIFSGNITFLSNYCRKLINLKSTASSYIKVMAYSNIVFESNDCNQLITVETDDTLYPYCLFQYITAALSTEVTVLQQYLHMYNIEFITNRFNWNRGYMLTLNYYTSHCRWLDRVFNGYDPGMINKNIIHIQNADYNNIEINRHINLCYCAQNGTYDCRTDVLGNVYPGQTLQADLCAPFNKNKTKVSLMYAETHNQVIKSVTCKIAKETELTAEVSSQHRKFNFTIVSNKTTDQCSLFLTAQPDLYKYYDVFLVQLLPCPIGFTLLNGICDCDPYLVNSDLQINTCYINEVAIKRPANSWIVCQNQTGETQYSISTHCPMDYCSPSTTKLNLEHPDSQCQFYRTGLLCSQCQNGLSMIFGSSRCMRCTNVYLLLSIVVLIAGVVLVVLLYCLNLTVTKGTINGIIFYANIISINGSVFLVNDYVYKPLKVFISFTNLDFGIETCFYNGMDSYAKMWLQLFFPFYLIMMATLLIITSRHSTRIQRLTFTRSLPVLATLFLLSYTGILRNVSTVLFSYSTIIELPSNHQHLVWSIDASVPLFGVKFTILFITCLISFVVLIPFNMTLLFTRYVMRFRIINRFKPLLDAFQGSYKHKHYYWIAVNIILRNVYFVLHMLTANVSSIVGAKILIIITSLYGHIYPHKSILVNIQEMFLLINLTIMYAASYHCSDTISSTITNVMITIALVHFTIILLYYFLTFTCHCNVENMLWNVKEKMIKCCHLTHYTHHTSDHVMTCEIPKRTYNYTEYREGLVTDDFEQ